MFCRLVSGRELMLREAGTNDYRILTESPKALKVLIVWLTKSGKHDQFPLAAQLLYEQ